MATPNKNPFFDVLRIRPNDVDNSINWYRKQINDLTNAHKSPTRLMQNKDLLVRRIIPGQLYMYFYDPKYKETLPYYDMFPLVYPYRRTQDGFMGYNLHYLPPTIRFKLMGTLMNIQMSKESEKKKLAYSYGVLNSSELNQYFSPCIKRYLTAHVASNFLRVPEDSWLAVALLPSERFAKASKNKVWKDSLGK